MNLSVHLKSSGVRDRQKNYESHPIILFLPYGFSPTCAKYAMFSWISIVFLLIMTVRALKRVSNFLSTSRSSIPRQCHRSTYASAPPDQIMVPSGLLPVYKPQDWSSQDVVGKVKNILRSGVRDRTNGQKVKIKVGHGGTLDPLAEGVLVLGIGEGTKLMGSYLTGAKSYHATALLGSETDSLDSMGTTTETMSYEHVTLDQLESVMRSQFTGNITQIPPMFSALKKNGKRLYELARKGEVVEREPRAVTISAIQLLRSASNLPEFQFNSTVSGGTYIRSLIADIARECDTRAHMIALLRTRQGPFILDDCLHQKDWNYDTICKRLIECSTKIDINVFETKPACRYDILPPKETG